MTFVWACIILVYTIVPNRVHAVSLVNQATLAMAIDVSALRQSDFWKKKFRRFVEVRDMDRDGYISRTDFMLIVDRLKKLNVSTPGHLERATDLLEKLSNSFGLENDSVRYSYDDFQDKWIGGMREWVQSGKIQKLFESLFDVLDVDEDGIISFQEWTAHYQIIGIITAHARASFNAIDTNHDQKISKDEFVNYHMEFYLSVENKLNSAILFGPLK